MPKQGASCPSCLFGWIRSVKVVEVRASDATSWQSKAWSRLFSWYSAMLFLHFTRSELPIDWMWITLYAHCCLPTNVCARMILDNCKEWFFVPGPHSVEVAKSNFRRLFFCFEDSPAIFERCYWHSELTRQKLDEVWALGPCVQSGI